jgi:hypothetical protein
MLPNLLKFTAFSCQLLFLTPSFAYSDSRSTAPKRHLPPYPLPPTVRTALRVPLVDLCTNTLSQEGTCYHSDHAILRCLMHGVYADIQNPSEHTDMCMDGCDWCSFNSTLTCHRWMANTSDARLTPQLIPSI